MNEKIDKRNLSEQVFEVLKDRIISGEYQVVDKLPSENALAQEFGVSRLTIRAAIARLCALGYVDVRNGEGTFVKESRASLQNFYPTIADSVTLENVNDFRQLMEAECVQMVTDRATKEDMEQLHACNQRFVEYLSQLNAFDTEQKLHIVELDFAFHLLICKLSGNPLYYMVYESVGDIIKKHMFVNLSSRWYFNRTDPKSEESRRSFAEGHSNILDAVASRDKARARSIARIHADYTSFAKSRG